MYKSVTFVTSNKGKLNEFKEIIGFEVAHQSIDLPEYQFETSEQVAFFKAKEAAKRLQGPALVDDTALHFHALGGLPGAYIRAFVEKLTPEKLTKLLAGFEDKSATVTCSMGYCAGPDAEPIVFTGSVEGTIVEPRGTGGFGFDPIFLPNGSDLTYAELPEGAKNHLSHRYLALTKLKESGILTK
ncbi:Inosine triphosphate pyrophosphatase [Histomonas meleagridis]|uniref:Inosine triphosphate pyrophosphatase n=1 Tax=Histomonas meleagridis TaxID=135588 RepID=UPI003559A480|nr:Inosine triphosphate pyrophosphatase [Histomonas meleagridis]KAH0806711.1 Inosine triphosphate pyrophosphatase [Histomonas meleagridis]